MSKGRGIINEKKMGSEKAAITFLYPREDHLQMKIKFYNLVNNLMN